MSSNPQFTDVKRRTAPVKNVTTLNSSAMIRTVVAIAAGLLLAACATTVAQHVAVPAEAVGALQVTSVSAAAQTGMLPHVPPKLEQAVQTELRKRKPGTKPASLKLAITRFQMVGSSGYFWAGAFAGSSYIDVNVSVIGADGAQIATFDVRREANPGGFGAFYDHETDMVQKTATAIVQTLYGEQ